MVHLRPAGASRRQRPLSVEFGAKGEGDSTDHTSGCTAVVSHRRRDGGIPEGLTRQRCVVIGTNIFMHDARPAGGPIANPDSAFSDERMGTVVRSSLSADAFRALMPGSDSIEPRLLPPPIAAASLRTLVGAHHQVALGSVNVTDYADYDWADEETMGAFRAADPHGVASSSETTHGLIRLQSEAPFLWVSAITDRVGRFNLEVTPREYAQNFAAAHNAGVVLAWMLPLIDAVAL